MDEYKAFEEAFEEHGYNLEKLCAAVPARPKCVTRYHAAPNERASNSTQEDGPGASDTDGTCA